MENKLSYIVVFIPAYNEEEKISETIKVTRDTYKPEITSKKGYRLEIIVINDGSKDRTKEIAENEGVRVVSHPMNLGLGAATRTAMKTAYEMGANVAVKLDADFQHDPMDIEKVIMPIIEDTADIVWGSRFKGNIKYKMPLYRKLGNKVFTFLMNRLTRYKISDAQTGLMAYGRRYLTDFQILSDYNPPQQILLDANSKNMRYAEVPVVFHPRTTGESFISFRYPFKVLSGIFRILVYANQLKVFVPIGIFFVFISFAVSIYDLILFYRELTHHFIKHANTVVLFFIGGIQIIFFGVLADLIIRKK